MAGCVEKCTSHLKKKSCRVQVKGERIRKDSSRNQESQQMEKKNLGGGGFISQTTNQMHPTVCGTHHLLTMPEPHLSALLSHSLLGWAMTPLNNSQTLPQFDSESPFSESRGRPTPALALLRGETRGRERRESPVSVVFSWLWRGAAPSCPSQPGSRSWCWRQSSGSGTFHTARNRGECPSAGWSLGSGKCDTSHIPLQGWEDGY